jgi:hypothetical protein
MNNNETPATPVAPLDTTATIHGIRLVMECAAPGSDLYDELYDAVRDLIANDTRAELDKLGRLGNMLADVINAMDNDGRTALGVDFDLCAKCGFDTDDHESGVCPTDDDE